MNTLIDVGHPADFLLFKEFAGAMQIKKHKILFTIRKKDVLLDLISKSNFQYYCLGANFHSLLGKIFGIFKFDIQLIAISLRFKPDAYLSAGSIYASHLAFLFRKPHIVCEDTGNMEQIKLYRPFVSTILTSSSFNNNLGSKQIFYNSYHELAYLHPKYFQPVRTKVIDLFDENNKQYIIVRFVSWSASHDIGLKGFSFQEKEALVKELSEYAKVYIISELELPYSLKSYQMPLHPSDLHHAITFASLIIGEGATVAAEAAVLGTPAIYVNPQSLGYLEEMGKFGLVKSFPAFSEKVIFEAKRILSNNKSKIKAMEDQKKLLNEKIDLTALLVWFIENYPESAKIMKANPDYQYNFR